MEEHNGIKYNPTSRVGLKVVLIATNRITGGTRNTRTSGK